MTNLNQLKKLPLAFIVFFLLGSFSFALDKKDPTPVPVNPQQECSQEEKNSSGPDTSVSPMVTPEAKPHNPDSFLLPPLLPEGANPKV